MDPTGPSNGANLELTVEDRLSLLELGEHVAHLGSLEWLPPSGRLVWSSNLFRIYGLAPGEITPTIEFVLSIVHPDDRHRVARYAEAIAHGSASPTIEYRVRVPRRGLRYLRSTVSIVSDGTNGARRLIGVVQDVTPQRLADQQITARVAVSGALAVWETFEESGARLLTDLAEALDCVGAVLWAVQHARLSARFVWSSPTLECRSLFEESMRAARIAVGDDLPGLAWQAGRPVLVTDLANSPGYGHGSATAQCRLRGALAVPAMDHGELLALFEFFYEDPLRPSSTLMATLAGIGREVAQFLSRRRSQLRPPMLTARELEVLRLAANGYSGPEIARQLVVSYATVATHMKHIFVRLDVSDRAAAVGAAVRLGIVD